jgi:heat shock protein HtpX
MDTVPSVSPPHLNVYSEIAANRRRTALLMAAFVVVVAALAYVLGELYVRGAGLVVVPLALVLAGAWATTSYLAGDRLVLGVSRARPVTEAEAPELHHVVEALAIGAGIPKPAVYVMEDDAPNAFATGRDPAHASIAVTTGLLHQMDRSELEGVVAHELSHVRNYDTRLMLVAVVLVGVVALVSDLLLRSFLWGGRGRDRSGGGGLVLVLVGLVAAIVAPLAAQVLRMAISRQREYLADASGALLTRYPPGLARALRKIQADRHSLGAANKGTAALYIANPLKDRPRLLDGLFDTHPPLEERIRRLEEM